MICAKCGNLLPQSLAVCNICGFDCKPIPVILLSQITEEKNDPSHLAYTNSALCEFQNSAVFVSDNCPWPIYNRMGQYNRWWKEPSVYKRILEEWVTKDNQNQNLRSWEAYMYGMCYEKKLVTYRGRANHTCAIEWFEIAAKANCVDAIIELIKLQHNENKWRTQLKMLFHSVSIDKQLFITQLMWPIDTNEKGHHKNASDACCKHFIDCMLQNVCDYDPKTRRQIYLWSSYMCLEGYFSEPVNIVKGMLFAELAGYLAESSGKAYKELNAEEALLYREFDGGFHTYNLGLSYQRGRVEIAIPAIYYDNGEVNVFTSVKNKLALAVDIKRALYWMWRSQEAGFDKAIENYSKHGISLSVQVTYTAAEEAEYEKMLEHYDSFGVSSLDYYESFVSSQ